MTTNLRPFEKTCAELEGRVALVTGAGSGIGRATARLFAREGAGVILADVDVVAGEAVAESIRASGGQAYCVRCDVTRPDDCQAAVGEAKRRFGALHVLFNNAGITRRQNVVEISVEDWDKVVAVNLRGVFLMSKFAVPLMASSGGGAVVNTGSGWGIVGGKDAAVYCATKGAVVNLTRAMALDHAAQNIRVNCVCPGDTDTALLAEEGRQLKVDPRDFRLEAAARPLNRIGTPEEIAQAVLYLSSDRSSFVTGSILVIDGGGTAA